MPDLRFLGTVILVALAACTSVEQATVSQDAASQDAVPEDINAGFIAADTDPQVWLSRFEIESREIFARRSELVSALGLEPGRRIADIGAGTGLFVGAFAAAVGDSGKVFAVDISPNLVRHMRERFADLGNVEVVLSEETSSTLSAGAVDVVFTCDTYHHFTHYRQMLASIHQTLSAGGELIVVDFEREPGVSRQWILDHVRADKARVIEEIEAAGFALDEEVEISGMAENYVLRFVKR